MLSSQDIVSGGTNSVSRFSCLWQQSVDDYSQAGFPEHELKLKFGCPVIFLRNMDPTRGLVNGTRMLVLQINNQETGTGIKCRIFSGEHFKKEDDITTIIFHYELCDEVPIEFTKRRFPVKVCSLMTLMKSQPFQVLSE